MGDIFGYKRSGKAQGVFSSDNSFLTFSGTSNVTGYLIQNWSIQYVQQVNEIFEIGSQTMYWIKGRPQGTGQIGRLLGAKGADNEGVGLFPSTAYDICDGGAMLRVTAVGGHCDAPPKGIDGGIVMDKGVNLMMDGCVVTNVGFGMTVADLRITEQYGWRFAFLEVK